MSTRLPKPLFKTKIASETDRLSIVNLCQRAVGSNDYVLSTLDKTIAAGSLFLAVDGERIIGMSNFQKSMDGTAWLSMARTDPEYRGMRVVGLLQTAMASLARKRGIKKMRFLINSSNTPSIKAAVRGGFKPICEIAHVSCDLSGSSRGKKSGNREEGDPNFHSISLSSSETKTIMSSSNYLKKTKGYFGYGWHFEKGSVRSFRAVAKKGRFYAARTGNDDALFLFGGAEEWDSGEHGEFFLLKGKFGSALESLKQYGRMTKLGSIGAFLPYDRHLIRQATDEHGFGLDPWADHGIVFERSVE